MELPGAGASQRGRAQSLRSGRFAHRAPEWNPERRVFARGCALGRWARLDRQRRRCLRPERRRFPTRMPGRHCFGIRPSENIGPPAQHAP